MAALVKDSTDNPAARAALHAIVSGALASAQGANPGAAAAGGFIASASADALAMAFYGTTADKLVGDEKTMISNLVVLLGAAAGAATGGDGQAIASGGNAARVEVENNSVANGEAGMIDMLTCALTGSTTACERAYPTPEQHATGLAVSVVTIGGIAIAGATPEMIAAINAGLKSCVTNKVLCANEIGVWAIEFLGAEAAPAGIAIGGTAAGIKLTAEQITELAALKAIQQKGGVVTSEMVSKVLGGKGTTGNISTLNPNEIRFSQNTVSYNKIERGAGTQYNYDDLVLSMKTVGWKGDAVDVIKMPDGKLTSMDNTRIAAAREAGIDIKANTYDFNDPLPENIINSGRFGNAKTWGEAITGRINNQSGGFSKDNPYGSDSLPRITGQK